MAATPIAEQRAVTDVRGSAGWALLLVVFPIAWLILSRVGYPSDGSAAYPDQSGNWQHGSVLVQRVFASNGLHEGDRVISVAGLSLARWPGDTTAMVRHGEVAYQVLRAGRVQSVSVRLSAYPLQRVIWDNIGALSVGVFTLVVGLYVFLNRPGDPAARLMLVLPALLLVGGAAFPFGIEPIEFVSGGVWRYVIGDVAYAIFWGGLTHMALSLPEPWPASRQRRLIIAGAYALPFVLYGVNLALTLPGANGSLGRAERLLLISGPAARVVPILVVVLFVISFRRTRDIEVRRRFRAVYAIVGSFLVVYVVVGQLSGALFGAPLIPYGWVPLVLLPMPIAIAAAILRYRMFDIQVIVKRSILYGVVVVVIGGLSVLMTILLVSLLPDRLLSALLSSLAAVTLFVTLGPRMRRWLGGLIYGQRDDPYEFVSRLGGLESDTDPAHLLSSVVDTVAAALRLPYVELELRSSEGVLESVARHGQAQGIPSVLPLVRGGREIGRLLLSVSSAQEPFGPSDRRLLDVLARQVSGAADTVLLNVALQRSRERLVLAREEERRRLRRDLHDGLGPTLAAAGIQVELLKSTSQGDAQRAVESMGTAVRQAIADLRRIVDGLRPPALDHAGLTEAVREVARRFSNSGEDDHSPKTLRVNVKGNLDATTLPAAVETAAYWIAAEAITNAAKHAYADNCWVSLWIEDDLHMEVADDGRGLAEVVTEGVGLGSMRERAAEIGGVCSIKSREGRGTIVVARIPVRSAPGSAMVSQAEMGADGSAIP
jgi:signal transduction histidine kinase